MATAEEVRVEADVLAVAAEAGEFAGLLGKVDRKRRLSGWPVDCAWWAAAAGPVRWLLVADGPGAVLAGRAAAEALSRASVRCVLSTGLCGALDESLRPGELVHAGEVIDGRGRHWTALDPDAQTRQVRLLSVGRVAVTAGEKRSLAAATGAEAVRWKPLAWPRRLRAMAGRFIACVSSVMAWKKNCRWILTFTATRMGAFRAFASPPPAR